MRKLDTGCDNCNGSKNYCDCGLWMNLGPCCQACTHE